MKWLVFTIGLFQFAKQNFINMIRLIINFNYMIYVNKNCLLRNGNIVYIDFVILQRDISQVSV